MGETPPVLTAREHRRLADVLLMARRERRALPPFSVSYPELTLVDARRIRDAVVSLCVAGGEQLIGAKVEAGADPATLEGSLGLLTSRMLLDVDAVDLERLIRPRVEAKLALVLGRPGDDADEQGLAATRVLPSLEIVDSRYEPGHPSTLDDIADSYGASLLRLGSGLSATELRLDRLTIRLQGVELAAARPFEGWSRLLAGEVPEHPPALAGERLILSPALAISSALTSRAVVSADFGELGELRLDVG